jgi:hypothetical protein
LSTLQQRNREVWTQKKIMNIYEQGENSEYQQKRHPIIKNASAVLQHPELGNGYRGALINFG